MTDTKTHYQIHFREYPGAPMVPSEILPRREWAELRAEQMQRDMPFATIEIRPSLD